MSEKISSRKELNSFSWNLSKFHDELYEAIESSFEDYDPENDIDEFMEIVDRIDELFMIKQGDIVAYTGSFGKNNTFHDYVESAEAEGRYKIAQYYRSVLYSGAFSCIPSDLFSDLIKILTNAFSPEIKKKKLAEITGISENDIGLILKKERHFPAEKQKEIISVFYNYCLDSMNCDKPELKEMREFISGILGKDLCVRPKRFYDIYFSFCDDIDEEKKELAELSGISEKDIEGIFGEEEYPYYPLKLHELSSIMMERSEEIIDTGSLDKNDRWYYNLLKNDYFDEDRKEQMREYEEYEKMARKETTDWFLSLPDMLKETVFEFITKQTDQGVYNSVFHDYIENYKDSEYAYCYNECDDKLSFILLAIRVFRQLPSERKEALLKTLREKLKPCYDDTAEHFSECALSSFYMASVVGKETLYEKYRNAPINNSVEATLYAQNRYQGLWQLEFIYTAFLKEMINFTSDEWKLAGYIESAIPVNFSPDIIFDILLEGDMAHEVYPYLVNETIYYYFKGDDIIDEEIYDEDL